MNNALLAINTLFTIVFGWLVGGFLIGMVLAVLGIPGAFSWGYAAIFFFTVYGGYRLHKTSVAAQTERHKNILDAANVQRKHDVDEKIMSTPVPMRNVSLN